MGIESAAYLESLSPDEAGTLIGVVMGFIGTFFVVFLVLAVLLTIAMWKIFKKAGEEGWKSLIPIYNMIVLCKISKISPFLLLIYLFAWVPFIGQLAVIGLAIYQNISLAKAFGKDVGFAVGLILLGPIFYMILAFGDATYVDAAKNKEVVVENK
jgi:CDP-diglyceride synthetase